MSLSEEGKRRVASVEKKWEMQEKKQQVEKLGEQLDLPKNVVEMTEAILFGNLLSRDKQGILPR